MAFLEWAELDPDDGGAPVQLLPYAGLILGDLDLGWPEHRDDVTDRAGTSGVQDRTSLHGARVVSAPVTGFTPTALRRVVASCGPARRPTLRFRRPGEPTKRVLLAGRSGGTVHRAEQPAAAVAALVWKAPDGIVETDAATIASVSFENLAGGRTYPRSGSRVYPAGGSVGTLELVNDGDQPAYPLLRVDGPCTDPAVFNDTTGERLRLDGYTVLAGSYVTWCPRTRQVFANGDRDASLLQYLETSGSTWFTIAPDATTTVVRFAPASASGPSQLTVTFRDSWLW